jgi:hypothetical protein
MSSSERILESERLKPSPLNQLTPILTSGRMFSAMKLFVAKETTQKFAVLSYGSYVANELDDEKVPGVYGGKGASLHEAGESLKLT